MKTPDILQPVRISYRPLHFIGNFALILLVASRWILERTAFSPPGDYVRVVIVGLLLLSMIRDFIRPLMMVSKDGVTIGGRLTNGNELLWVDIKSINVSASPFERSFVELNSGKRFHFSSFSISRDDFKFLLALEKLSSQE